MTIGQWWPKISENSQVWLLQNMGSDLPAEVSEEIVAAGGTSDARLSDTENEWLDEVNNGGTPA
jgi:hypothetical protein